MADVTKKEETKVEATVEETKVDTQKAETEETKTDKKDKEPGKFKSFLGKCGRGVKKALPYVGAFAAGAGTVAGALIVAAARSNSSNPAIEKDSDLEVFEPLEVEATMEDAEE